MDKLDVLKIVRANDDKFKLHLDKMRRLEEKENRIKGNNVNVPKEDKGFGKLMLKKNNEDYKVSNYVYNQLFNSIENENHDTQEENNKQCGNIQQKSINDKALADNDKSDQGISNLNNNTKFPPEGKHINKSNKHQTNEFDKKETVVNNSNVQDKEQSSGNRHNIIHYDNDAKNKFESIEQNSKASKQLKEQKEEIIPLSLQKDNLSKVREHYADSDTSNSFYDNDSFNKEKNQKTYYNDNAQLKDQSNEYDGQIDNNRNISIKPTHSKNLNIKSLIKPNLPETINAAVNNNESKRSYTAYTYSTIQKIKTKNKPPKSNII